MTVLSLISVSLSSSADRQQLKRELYLTALEINHRAEAIVVTGNPDGNFSDRAAIPWHIAA
ncbi:MAG TPA: hypothetical protein DCY88_01635 [Cyanobacteria bacterium UBA11372]|nr:hypothetical protein [Cyanobacteria bacterium UBA11372]